jgi:threonylcarbamoyladenosine tRNA methylthiotransferase MtaB
VDITAYGLDLPGRMRLGGLVRHILRHVPELKRLRLSSIDQIEADKDLLHAIAEEPRLMPHLHLSLQSGDDMILKRMKRRHTRADAIRFCTEVRRLRPDVAFGADLIAGFPTETEEMLAGSLRLVDECGLAFLHVFPFSPRPGTPAARMPQVAGGTVKERAARLREKGRMALAGFLEAQVGCDAEVLLEQPGLGRTASFAEVEVATDRALDRAAAGVAVPGEPVPGEPAPGELVNVRVTATDGLRLRGEPNAPKFAQ